MSDKLKALSQPVAYRNRYTDVFYPAEDNSMRTVAMGTAPTIYSPAYSQEYVTALLAALEEKDTRALHVLQHLRELKLSALLVKPWVSFWLARFDLTRPSQNQMAHLVLRSQALPCRLWLRHSQISLNHQAQ
ncbi:hypothetical protein [Serratia fonticola]|uniref:hypothetical protein n=1 Tax=Serratia fonticola TaxID=47917 RepID=UPI000938D084|nr:hypothetical protein [Serratia fonticola]OKP30936.1 hypothetical protein BSQ40_03170 [Serratia fonticola]